MCLALPGRVLSIAGDGALQRTGRVGFGSTVNDYVIVHVGMATNIPTRQLGRSLSRGASQSERCRQDSAKRPRPERGLRRLRLRVALWRRKRARRGIVRMRQRAHSERSTEATRVPGLQDALHAGKSAWGTIVSGEDACAAYYRCWCVKPAHS